MLKVDLVPSSCQFDYYQTHSTFSPYKDSIMIYSHSYFSCLPFTPLAKLVIRMQCGNISSLLQSDSLASLAPAAAPRLFSCCSLCFICCSKIASTSAAACSPISSTSAAVFRLRLLQLLLPDLRPLQMLLFDFIHFSCCFPITSACFSCCSLVVSA